MLYLYFFIFLVTCEQGGMKLNDVYFAQIHCFCFFSDIFGTCCATTQCLVFLLRWQQSVLATCEKLPAYTEMSENAAMYICWYVHTFANNTCSVASCISIYTHCQCLSLPWTRAGTEFSCLYDWNQGFKALAFRCFWEPLKKEKNNHEADYIGCYCCLMVSSLKDAAYLLRPPFYSSK